MKNTKKSQIIALVIFAALTVGISAIYSGSIGSSLLLCAGAAATALAIMIYYIACARKKLIAVAVDIIAVICCMYIAVDSVAGIEGHLAWSNQHGYSYTVEEQSLDLLHYLKDSISIIPIIVWAILLLTLLLGFIPKGYFSRNATCAICGKKTGMNRFKIGKRTDGYYIWQCPDCAAQYRGKAVRINYDTGKVDVLSEQETEVKVKCNVCGHVHCYTLNDVFKNQQHAKNAAISSAMALGNAIGGTQFGIYSNSAKADRELDKVIDFSRCPKCNSTDIRPLSKEEWQKEQAATVPSTTDELKKYKELLDTGVITQEEFDTKKKQLLGL